MHLRLVGLHPCERVFGLQDPGGSEVIDPEAIDDWRKEANCVHVENKEIFFADARTIDGAHNVEIAVGICQTCPVRVPCLKDGINQHHGIWAGWTPEERHELRARIHHMPGVVANVLLTAAAQRGPSRYL